MTALDPLRTVDEILRRNFPDLCIADLSGPARREQATRDVLAALGPRLATLDRVEALFEGGPDTACRTTWRGEGGLVGFALPPRMECVEVPMADLRLAFGVADAYPDGHTCADPDAECAACEADTETLRRPERTPPS